MFRFIYALHASEHLQEGSLRNEEFDGYEAAAVPPHGVPLTGVRIDGWDVREISDDLASVIERGALYARLVHFEGAPVHTRHALARRLDELASSFPADRLLLVSPAPSDSLRDTWQLCELLTHRNVRIAWDATPDTAASQPPGVAIPTLNLRIGLVRVRDGGPQTLEIARRLAGIGFEGYFLVDPTTQEDRVGAARQIVEVVRDLLQPRKIAKAAPAKVVKK
jgi:hypothetical protein